MKNIFYPRNRMYHTTAWQIWAIGWRFIFFSYFFATLALILGLGQNWWWGVVFLPFFALYHYLGSSLWNGKQWTRIASIIEHIAGTILELLLVVMLFALSPKTPGWRSFSWLVAKIFVVDFIVRAITFYYLYTHKDFPQNYFNLIKVSEKKIIKKNSKK